jgi:hypothetical protein
MPPAQDRDQRGQAAGRSGEGEHRRGARALGQDPGDARAGGRARVLWQRFPRRSDRT